MVEVTVVADEAEEDLLAGFFEDEDEDGAEETEDE